MAIARKVIPGDVDDIPPAFVVDIAAVLPALGIADRLIWQPKMGHGWEKGGLVA